MRLALMSDIHGNIDALQACLAHAQGQSVDRYAFLGDLVGYGPRPAPVMERIMEMAEQGAIVLQGNHDVLAVNPPESVMKNEDAGASWTHNQLSPAQREFITGLPLSARWESALLVHASAQDPKRWTYVVDARTAQLSLDSATQDNSITHVFGGHVHLQTLYYRGAGRNLMPFTPSVGVPVPVPKHRQWLATIGSVGQPRDGNPRAMYAIFDSKAMTLTFQRVPYDHLAVARAAREVGLPEFFAARLEIGR
jgi:diadenosine tetraphosphatase ApaH/serine/threonine PP2A family protein phosphatase